MNKGHIEQVGSFKPALISKGLRLGDVLQRELVSALQASPDFKGIKTVQLVQLRWLGGFKPALISKGLRPF